MTKLIDALDAIGAARRHCGLLHLAAAGLPDVQHSDGLREGVAQVLDQLFEATCKLETLLEEKTENSKPSPMMVLFEEWNRLHTVNEGITDEEASLALSAQVDRLMIRILAMPATDARDMAAKVACYTFFGEHTDFNGDKWRAGADFIRECAALVGCADQVAQRLGEAS